jgi:Ricin-type beta-trefoil lectin domain
VNLGRAAVGRGRWGAVGVATALALVVVASAVFLITQAVSAANSSAPVTAVPAEYRAAIVESGASCPALSPARVAAQIMVESGFSPTATNGRGGRGLAGLTVDEWKTWKPWDTATRTDSRADILALAHLTCDLVGHVRADKIDGDLWQLALGARYSGVDAVTSARGVPAAAQQYVTEAVGYAADYEHDAVLTGASPSPSPSPSQSVADSPSPSAQPSSPAPSASVAPGAARAAAPKTSAAAPPAAPAPAPPPPSQGRALVSRESGKCLSATAGGDGKPLVLATCNGSVYQQWQAYIDGTIRATSLCMDSPYGSTSWGTYVQLAYCTGNPAQKFSINANNQIVYAGLCVDVDNHQTADGTSIILWQCTGGDNQNWSWR